MVAALVVLGLVVAYMVYVYFQYKDAPWRLSKAVAERLVQTSTRDPEQKRKDNQLLDDLIQAARDGEFGDDGFKGLAELFAPCQAYASLLAPNGFFQPLIRASGLNEEERSKATSLLMRYCAAVRDGLLTEEDHKKWGESWPQKDEVGEDMKMSDEQIRKIVSGLEDMLSTKSLPADAAPFDYEYELARLLNEARRKLGRPVESLPATQPTATTQRKDG